MMLKQTSFLFFLSFVLSSLTVNAKEEAWSVNQSLLVRFEEWKLQHDKTYSFQEEEERFENWIQNDERIWQHNSQTPTPKFTLGHNAFSDMKMTEIVQRLNLQEKANNITLNRLNHEKDDSMKSYRLLRAHATLPDHVNWVESGAVTHVKNQGMCGSCWAFSTTGALEGALFIKTGKLISLSEQNLLDCDRMDLGCYGGVMDNAFKFDQKSGGICSEEDYPYVAKRNPTCFTNCTSVPGSTVKTLIDVPPGSETALLSSIALQPVSIAVKAATFSFLFYRHGVLTDDNCGKNGSTDHAVLAVGYGIDLETQEPYYLVKNCWGVMWGDKGYIKVGRKSKNEMGVCAILSMASFPILQ